MLHWNGSDKCHLFWSISTAVHFFWFYITMQCLYNSVLSLFKFFSILIFPEFVTNMLTFHPDSLYLGLFRTRYFVLDRGKGFCSILLKCEEVSSAWGWYGFGKLLRQLILDVTPFQNVSVQDAKARKPQNKSLLRIAWAEVHPLAS